MDTLFRSSLEAIVNSAVEVPPILDPTSPHSNFGSGGQGSLEVRNWIGSTSEYRDRILANQTRRAWLDQTLGMCLWNLTASDQLSEVAFYNPNASKFSDDGQTIRAPWGYRLLHGGADSKLGQAITLLESDPSSLRAIIPIWGDEDLGVRSRDVPCLVAIQLLLRGNKLDATFFLRSLNPYWVWPYDHFFLSLILEMAANHIGRETGTITYFASSLQVSPRDVELINLALAESLPAPKGMSPLEPEDMWKRLESLTKASRATRHFLQNPTLQVSKSALEASMSELPDWWKDFFSALTAAYAVRNNIAVPELSWPKPNWATCYISSQNNEE